MFESTNNHTTGIQRNRHGNSEEAHEIVEAENREIELYEKYKVKVFKTHNTADSVHIRGLEN